MITDGNGNVIGRHDYLPYGEEIAAGVGGRSAQFALASDTAAKFTGQLRDQESGLDYFNARYYIPQISRFNSPDPMSVGADLSDPQTWNGYVYVRGNPLGMVDPSGRCGYIGPENGTVEDFNDPYNYIDDDGVESCAEAFGATTPISETTSTSVSQLPTISDYFYFYQLWSSGSGPSAINYGPNDGWTKALANSFTFNQIRQQYAASGCPASTPPFYTTHFTPFLEGYVAPLDPNGASAPNYALMAVGGFQATATTANNVTTFTITNTAGQASFSGASTLGPTTINNLSVGGLFFPPLSIFRILSHDGVYDNPYGENGPNHNITQTFTWTENNVCHH